MDLVVYDPAQDWVATVVHMVTKYQPREAQSRPLRRVDSIRYLFLNRVYELTVHWTALAIIIRFTRG